MIERNVSNFLIHKQIDSSSTVVLRRIKNDLERFACLSRLGIAVRHHLGRRHEEPLDVNGLIFHPVCSGINGTIRCGVGS